MQEYELIQRFFTHKTTHPNVQLGVGDDAAILDIPNAYNLITSIDTMVNGINFPEETLPEDIGYKALAISLSDMAAMGAKPETVLLSLTLPAADESWLTAFSEGFYELLDAHRMALVGGDITKGPLSVTTTVNGLAPKDKAILRSGAKDSDLIYVTGNLGDAGLAIQLLKKQKVDNNFLKNLNRPTPRVDAGIALRNIASAAIDISDGLATDLEKLCIASQMGARVTIDDLPLSQTLISQVDLKTAVLLALTAGDDFELCFTVPPKQVTLLDAAFSNVSCGYHCIGKIDKEKGLKLYQKNGTLMELKNKGFEHF